MYKSILLICLLVTGCVPKYDFIGTWDKYELTYFNNKHGIKISFPSKEWEVYTKPENSEYEWERYSKKAYPILMAKKTGIDFTLIIENDDGLNHFLVKNVVGITNDMGGSGRIIEAKIIEVDGKRIGIILYDVELGMKYRVLVLIHEEESMFVQLIFITLRDEFHIYEREIWRINKTYRHVK